AAQSDLQPVRLLGKSIGKVAGDFDRLGFRDAVLGNEPRQKGAIDAAGDIMARRNRKKGARVVVEAYGVVEAGRFRCLLTEAHEPFRAVVEPPCRPELERWIMSSERCQLTTVSALIEREDDDREGRIVAEAVEQRVQRTNIVGRHRNIGTDVRAKALEQRGIVVTPKIGRASCRERVEM